MTARHAAPAGILPAYKRFVHLDPAKPLPRHLVASWVMLAIIAAAWIAALVDLIA